MNTFNNLVFLVKPYWRHGRLYLLGRLTIPLLILPAIAFLQVTLVQRVIEAISAGATMEEVLILAGTIVGSIFVLTATRWSFLLLYDRWKVAEIRNRINRSIYVQSIATDYRYFDNPEFYNDFTFAVGELAAKSEAALTLLSDLIETATIIITMTAYLAFLGPWMILISLLGQGICLLAQKRIEALGIQIRSESLPHERKLQYIHRLAYQRQYAADLKSTSLPKAFFAIFDNSGAAKVAISRRLSPANLKANMVQFVAWHLCQFAQLAYLIYCAYTQYLGLGMITGMFAAAGRLNDQLNRFVGLSGRGMELNLYTQKIRTFFAYPSVIEPQETGLAAPAKAFSLELRNVSFSYPDSEFSLHNINLKVAAGDRIAIVGENGVGKTTLAKLLLRLYDVDSGEILYNGEPLKEYAIHDLRQRIGVAFQEPQIYALGVRQYLQTYHESEDEVLQDLLTQVGLPLDLDAQLTREFDSRGVMLSGGQGQKLGLVRLLHGEFGLLLLDEPSAALDPLAEDAMVRLIFQQATTTTIMVAHRLSTVRDADCIYLLADGSIAEMGSHDELMALGGRYARMFARQRENYVR